MLEVLEGITQKPTMVNQYNYNMNVTIFLAYNQMVEEIFLVARSNTV